jgi:hypothetical protein
MRSFIVAPKPMTSPLQPLRPRLGDRHDVRRPILRIEEGARPAELATLWWTDRMAMSPKTALNLSMVPMLGPHVIRRLSDTMRPDRFRRR